MLCRREDSNRIPTLTNAGNPGKDMETGALENIWKPSRSGRDTPRSEARSVGIVDTSLLPQSGQLRSAPALPQWARQLRPRREPPQRISDQPVLNAVVRCKHVEFDSLMPFSSLHTFKGCVAGTCMTRRGSDRPPGDGSNARQEGQQKRRPTPKLRPAPSALSDEPRPPNTGACPPARILDHCGSLGFWEQAGPARGPVRSQ